MASALDPPPLIAPGSEGAPPPGLINRQKGLDAEGIIPDASQTWWNQVNLNKLNTWFGTPEYPGVATRWFNDYQSGQAAEKGGEHKLTAEEANAQYNMESVGGVKFNEPVYKAIARDRYSSLERQQSLRNVISQGPPMSRWGEFTSGLNATFQSPGDVLLGLGAGELVGAGAGALGLARTGIKGLANIYGQNLVGNIALSVPLRKIKEAQGEQTSFYEDLKGDAINAALFTGLHYVLAPVFERISRTPKDLQESGLREALAQHEAGLRMDQTRTVETMAARESGIGATGPAPYAMGAPGEHPSSRAYYQITHPDTAQPMDLTGYHGSDLIDHPAIAENLSRNPEGAGQGKATEVAIHPETKLLDLEQTLHEPEVKELAEQIQAKLGVDLKLTPEMTLKEVLDHVKEQGAPSDQPHLMSEVQNVAKEAGFDGYQYTNSINGEPHHRGVTLFSDEHAIPTGNEPQTVAETPRYPSDPIDLPTNEPEQAAGYDPKKEAKLQVELDEIPKTPEQQDAVTKNSELVARRLLSKVAEENPSVADAVTAVDQEYTNAGKARQGLREFVGCFGRSIT